MAYRRSRNELYNRINKALIISQLSWLKEIEEANLYPKESIQDRFKKELSEMIKECYIHMFTFESPRDASMTPLSPFGTYEITLYTDINNPQVYEMINMSFDPPAGTTIESLQECLDKEYYTREYYNEEVKD